MRAVAASASPSSSLTRAARRRRPPPWASRLPPAAWPRPRRARRRGRATRASRGRRKREGAEARAAPRALGSDRFRERDHPRLAGGIRCHRRGRQDRGDRGHVDNVRPAGRGPKPRQKCLAAQRRADEVRVDHPPPLRLGHRAHLACGTDSGGVDEQVEHLPLVSEPIAQRSPLSGMADVHPDPQHEVWRRRLGGVPAVDRVGQVDAGHMPAILHERLGERPAEAAGGAGHHGRPPGDQTPGHRCRRRSLSDMTTDRHDTGNDGRSRILRGETVEGTSEGDGTRTRGLQRDRLAL